MLLANVDVEDNVEIHVEIHVDSCWWMVASMLWARETWIDLERPGLEMEFILSQPTPPPPKGAPLGAAFSSSSRLAAANWYSFSCKVERIKAVIDMKNTWDGKIDCKKKTHPEKAPSSCEQAVACHCSTAIKLLPVDPIGWYWMHSTPLPCVN